MKAQVIDISRRREGAPNAFLPNGFRKPKNADVRSREYLTTDEVDYLMRAAKGVGRPGKLVFTKAESGQHLGDLSVGPKAAQLFKAVLQFAIAGERFLLLG